MFNKFSFLNRILIDELNSAFASENVSVIFCKSQRGRLTILRRILESVNHEQLKRTGDEVVKSCCEKSGVQEKLDSIDI
ncbi:MAG TPA: hypothetical protein VE954_35920 [Oligoflexus sp.]|nr:hypothetical protein [Oligoflexus sp.]